MVIRNAVAEKQRASLASGRSYLALPACAHQGGGMSASPGPQSPSPGTRRSSAGGTFGLGRIAGVPVRVNGSVLIIMVVIAAQLASQTLPAAYPGRPAWEYWLVGLGAGVVFLLGLLAHELAHSVVARRNGIEVQSITLWMFGGVTQMSGGGRTPRAQLGIAGGRPLARLLGGGGVRGVAPVPPAPGGRGPVA